MRKGLVIGLALAIGVGLGAQATAAVQSVTDEMLQQVGYANQQFAADRYEIAGASEAQVWLENVLQDAKNTDPGKVFAKAHSDTANDLIQAATGPDIDGFVKPTGGSPVMLADDGGKTVALVGILRYHDIFNTLHVNQDERARDVAESDGYQLLAKLAVAVPAGTPVDEIGVLISYGSRDYSDNMAEPTGETICLTAPLSAAQQYNAGTMTDSNFIPTVQAYLLAFGATEVEPISVQQQ